MISAFDIFKIGIGPSSSHTVGPMNAGKSFIDRLESSGLLTATSHIVVDLYVAMLVIGVFSSCEMFAMNSRRWRSVSCKESAIALKALASSPISPAP